MKTGHLLLAALALFLVGRRLVRWFQANPIHPDPWSKEIEDAIHRPEAMQLCFRCLEPLPADARFCPDCDSAVDPCLNLSPYLGAFSFGACLRRGTRENFRVSIGTALWYVLVTLAQYGPFATVYWFFLLRNGLRIQTEVVRAAPSTAE